MNEACDRRWAIAFILERIFYDTRIASYSSCQCGLRCSLESKTDDQLRKICITLSGLP